MSVLSPSQSSSAPYTPPAETDDSASRRAKDNSPALPARVHSGDLWQLGRHRLLCGDSTDPAQVRFLMAEERAALTITSPPYNIGGRTGFPNSRSLGASKYLHQTDALPPAEYLNFLIRFTENVLSVSEVVIVNLQMLGANKVSVVEYLHHFRKQLIDIAVWDKLRARPVMTKNVLNVTAHRPLRVFAILH